MINLQPITYNLQQKKTVKKNVVGRWLSVVSQHSGQSLIEVLVGLAIGAILIGSAGLGISFMLKSTTSNDNLQGASGIVRQTLDEVRSYISADWQNIYGLTKGLDTQYFLNASGTTFYSVQGKEGVLSRDVTSGLIGRWGLDEATGTVAYDMSGNGNDGVLTNNPTRATSTCWVGYCLDLNGTNNYVYVTNGGIFDLAKFSWTVWIKPSWVSGVPSYNPAVVALRNILNTRMSMHIRSNYSNLDLWNGSSLQSFPYTFQPDDWYHIVFTYNSGVATIYINGVAIGSNSFTQGSTTLLPLYIGSSDGTAEYFNGSIDDVRIYNRTLTATEVKNLYESKQFSAYFSVENVCRSNDSSSTITDTEPCQSGSIVDPITEEITAKTEWNTRGTTDNVSLVDYITRWKNKVFYQTDWSGGSGVDGPLTNPTTQYSSSTNIDATTNPGSLRIKNL